MPVLFRVSHCAIVRGMLLFRVLGDAESVISSSSGYPDFAAASSSSEPDSSSSEEALIVSSSSSHVFHTTFSSRSRSSSWPPACGV